MPAGGEAHYCPTPEEIERECELIRQEWSAAERAKRCCGRPGRWEPPTIAISHPEKDTGGDE